ncbi:MAG: RNA-binding protein [Proteobacteria bacterium]|nr:MAG: RNA-binding protein [Pseudomonadota bacterium]PIE65167.1 MAG: RNA-binding protein [Desulfobacterales bacterium]
MCQIRVYMEQDGKEKLLLDDVTRLSIDNDGITVSTLFTGPAEIKKTVIRSIDFMAGKVLLEATP